MSDLFDNALRFVQDHDPDFKPGYVKTQKRPTSLPFEFHTTEPVKLLVEVPSNPVYRKDGELAKRQPGPHQVGETLYAKLDSSGYMHIVPFSMAGQGYEVIDDAIEGVHYEFLNSPAGAPKKHLFDPWAGKGGIKRPPSWEIGWVFIRLSNGIELELRERLKVRSRIDVIAQGTKKVRVNRGDDLYLVHVTNGQLNLVVPDPDGDQAKDSHDLFTVAEMRKDDPDWRTYHSFGEWDVIERAKEGVHFDVIDGEKVLYPDIALRKELNRHMRPLDALNRAKRELAPADLAKMMK